MNKNQITRLIMFIIILINILTLGSKIKQPSTFGTIFYFLLIAIPLICIILLFKKWDRYFVISYVTNNFSSGDVSIECYEFPSRKEVVEEIKEDIMKNYPTEVVEGIIIMSIYEFKTKDDYERWNNED